MTERERFSADEARTIGEQIGVDWSTAPFDIEQFRRGMDVELEHGLGDPLTNVTDDDPVVTGKIALAHLHEFPDYYTRLERDGGAGEARGLRRHASANGAFDQLDPVAVRVALPVEWSLTPIARSRMN